MRVPIKAENCIFNMYCLCSAKQNYLFNICEQRFLILGYYVNIDLDAMDLDEVDPPKGVILYNLK